MTAPHLDAEFWTFEDLLYEGTPYITESAIRECHERAEDTVLDLWPTLSGETQKNLNEVMELIKTVTDTFFERLSNEQSK